MDDVLARSAPPLVPGTAPIERTPRSRRDACQDLSHLVAVIGLLALLFAPVLLGHAHFAYRDTGRLHAPTKHFIASELRSGHFPEWNPYAGAGIPIVAGAVDSVQHPFNLLFLVLPFDAAFDAWVLLSYLMAAIGGYAWARVMGRGRAAATSVAIAFALSGALLSASDNVSYLTAYAALPLLLAAAQAYSAHGGPGRLAVIGLASGLCAAAGDPQSWGIALALVVILPSAMADRGDRRRALGRGVPAAIAAVVGAAPFLMPIALWLPLSSRAHGVGAADLQRWNMHPLRLMEAFLPGLFRADPADPLSGPFGAYCGDPTTPIPWFRSVYIGAAPLALALAGAATSRRAKWLVAAAGVLAWAALGPYAGFDQLAGYVPILRSFRYAEKLFVWPTLLVGFAAAYGIDVITSASGLQRRFAVACGGLAAAAFACALIALTAPAVLIATVAHTGSEAQAAMLVRQGGLAALETGLVLLLVALTIRALSRGNLGPSRAGYVLTAVVALDVLAAGAPAYVVGRRESGVPPLASARTVASRIATPFSLREDRWPDLGRAESTWRWGWRTLASAWNVEQRVGNLSAYTGMHERRLHRLYTDLDERAQVRAAALWGWSGVVVPQEPGLAARAGVTPPFRVLAADPELPAFVVEIPHRDRVYLEDQVRSVDENGAFAFVASGGEGGGSVVEGKVLVGLSAVGAAARIVVDEPGRTEILVKSPGPALLVVGDALVPGWSAKIDGRPAAIVRANYLVRGVWVLAGAHSIVFQYRTPGLAAGWAIAMAGGLAIGSWSLARRRRGSTAQRFGSGVAR